MATYVTKEAAAIVLARVAGLTVPSILANSGMDGTGTAMDDYITEASNLIEEYIGYPWAMLTDQKQTVLVDRSGQAQMEGLDQKYHPLLGITNAVVPSNAQYYGLAISLSFLKWNLSGCVSLDFPSTNFSQDSYIINPISLIQASYTTKVYPDSLELTYSCGTDKSPPLVFRSVCLKLLKVLILMEENPNLLTHNKDNFRQGRFGLQTQEDFKDDPLLHNLLPLSRYQR